MEPDAKETLIVFVIINKLACVLGFYFEVNNWNGHSLFFFVFVDLLSQQTKGHQGHSGNISILQDT